MLNLLVLFWMLLMAAPFTQDSSPEKVAALPPLTREQIMATAGVTAEWADLLTGDRTTAALFRDSTSMVGFPEVAAKWIVNELPRALAGKELRDVGLDAIRFSEFIKLVGEHVLEVTPGAVEGQEDPPPRQIGDAAGADVDHGRCDVRLLEVGVRGVEDEGNTPRQFVTEDRGELGVGPFRQARRVVHHRRLPGVEMHVEVPGL